MKTLEATIARAAPLATEIPATTRNEAISSHRLLKEWESDWQLVVSGGKTCCMEVDMDVVAKAVAQAKKNVNLLAQMTAAVQMHKGF